MTSLSLLSLAPLWLGFLLGVRHAADPDHVVAVSAIASRTRALGPAVRLGAAWGLGHTVTLFIAASAIVVFDWAVPPRVGLGLEFAVALALVFVGLANVRRDRHQHMAAGLDSLWRAFVVGLVHGLAGSAAVALLVVAATPDAWLACAYLGLFGLGTLTGMTAITAVLALPMVTTAKRFAAGDRVLRVTTGAISLAFGIWLACEIGWSDGLFAARPQWTPH